MDNGLGITTSPDPDEPVWVWHPSVHAHYEEQLCYFLIAIKPYVHAVFQSELTAILDEFKVPESGICCYPLFGTFDLLIRVWLPAGQRNLFFERVGKMTNCRQRASFDVDRVLLPWGFENAAANDSVDIPSQVDELVRKVQEGDDAEREVWELRQAGLLADGRAKERVIDAKKAFILIGADASLSGTARGDHFISVLKANFRGNAEVLACALYSGSGAAWLLAKLLVQDFYAIGRFVQSLHENHSHESLSTNTFVVCEEAHKWRQGDAICGTSIVMKRGRHKTVAVALPELYEGQFNRSYISKIEEYALRVLAPSQLLEGVGEVEKKQIIEFLRGVVTRDRRRVFSVLFPVFGETEEELRLPLPQAANDILGKDGVRLLSEKIDKANKATKPGESLKFRSLGDVLLAWQLLAHEWLQRNSGEAIKVELQKIAGHQLQEIVTVRNNVMHYGAFDDSRGVEWCERLFEFFALRAAVRRLMYLMRSTVTAGAAQVGPKETI